MSAMFARWLLSIVLVVSCTVSAFGADQASPSPPHAHDYLVTPVPFNRVRFDDAFWRPRLDTSRKVTIPYAFLKCEQTDRISNFEKAAGLRSGKHIGAVFNDSDVYKVMEGAAYLLQVQPDTMMRLYLDQLIRIVAGAQWNDGYLYTLYSLPQRQPEKRWSNVRSLHELYCMGHMYEAAVAHYQVTGNRTFLDVARRSADLVCRVFNPDGRTDPPGHEEIEIGLCKLYRATGDAKYLHEAKFFLDQRGRLGHRGANGKGGLYGKYAQDHIPVVQQTTAVGHSVRAAYLYTGMADVAALTGNMEYVQAIETIWNDVVKTKLYITGGIGAASGSEAFGGPYELPNRTAYCETCASIANILWNHRMFLMTGNAKYIDVLERTMYNAALSGISLDGKLFFYPNVLESLGGAARSPWFGCACCPSNIARFIPSVPGFAYAYQNGRIFVNLYAGGESVIDMAGNPVTLEQETRYPWQGDVTLTVKPQHPAKFEMRLRIPQWARNQVVPSDLYTFVRKDPAAPRLVVNGTPFPFVLTNGYTVINRTWQSGDTVVLHLPMPVRRVVAHSKVVTDRGKVALQRGPIVYCLEGVDNDKSVLELVIPDDAELTPHYRADLLGGVMTITGQARIAKRTSDGHVKADATRPFMAIPYYAWAHRGRSQMTVWPARVAAAARPRPADTLTSISRATASFVHVSLDAIKDQVLPANSADTSGSQLDFWPHKGTTEWIEFQWRRPHKLTRVKVYWFDDTGRGECRLPKSWRVLYRDKKKSWQPVHSQTAYPIAKDRFNTIEFEPVTTTAIRLEVTLRSDWSAGVQEVVIE